MNDNLAVINVIVLCINVTILYANYRHSRQKEFHESLYRIKIDAYKELIERCNEAYIALDINSTPFVQIYDFQDKETWRDYYQRNVGNLVHIGFDIEKIIFKQTMFLPSEVMDTVFKFSTACIRYVVIAVHFDTALIIQKQDEIHELLFELINSFRKDLGIELINESLMERIEEMSINRL